MTVEEKIAQLRAWLARTDRAQAETGDGYIPDWLAAEAIGESESTLRRIRDEDDSPLRFRPRGRGSQRHRWQVELASIAAFLVWRDAQATGYAGSAGSANSGGSAGAGTGSRRP